MDSKNIRIKDLPYNDQPIWFIENKYNRFQPVHKNGWIVFILVLSFMIGNIWLSVSILDTQGITKNIEYISIIQLIMNILFSIGIIIQFCRFAGLKKK